jgi:hypothetical protein
MGNKADRCHCKCPFMAIRIDCAFYAGNRRFPQVNKMIIIRKIGRERELRRKDVFNKKFREMRKFLM